LKRVAVIGVGGVGMAHVVASERSGNKVVAIVDKNETILEKVKSEWTNSWDSVNESVPVNSECQYFTDCLKLSSVNVDLCIIATPPETHYKIIHYLKIFYSGKIIVEKPISLEFALPTTNVFVSSEWIYHSKVDSLKDIRSMSMTFQKSSTTKWDKYLPAILDFIPHFISILTYKNYYIDSIEFSKTGRDSFTGTITTNKGTIEISGARDSNAGFLINNELFDWELELFDRQIQFGGLSLDNVFRSHNLLIQKYLEKESA
jgi:hypothetical protein